MTTDRKHLGRTYGPYRFEVSRERIRDFALALAGGIPGRTFTIEPDEPPHPWFVDPAAAQASPYGSVIAPPTFGASFAIQPFSAACADPELGIDLVRLVHGEQEFEYLGVIRAGDLIETAGEITGISSKGKLDFLVVTTTSRKVPSGEVVLKGTWTAIVRN